MQVWEKTLDFQTSVILFSSPELWFLAVGKLLFTHINGHQVWSSVTMFFWTWWYKTHKHRDTKLIKVTLAHMFWQNIHLTPVGFLIRSETCQSGVHVQLNIVMGVGSMVWACPSSCMHTVQVTSLCRCHLLISLPRNLHTCHLQCGFPRKLTYILLKFISLVWICLQYRNM